MHVAPLIFTQQALLCMLGVTLCIGAAVFLTPAQGLFFSVAGLASYAAISYFDSAVSDKAILKLHEEAKRLLETTSTAEASIEFDPMRIALDRVDSSFGARYCALLKEADVSLEILHLLERNDYLGLGVSLGHAVKLTRHFKSNSTPTGSLKSPGWSPASGTKNDSRGVKF